MKLLFRLFVAAVLVGIVSAYIYFKDGERYKADLELYLSETSDYQIRINGDIQWHIWPTLGLSAQNISATDSDDKIHVGGLTLKAQFGNIFSAIDSWQIHQFVLEDVRIDSEGTQVVLNKLEINDFRPSEASPFSMDLAYTSPEPDASTDTMTLQGQVTFTRLESTNSAHSVRVAFKKTQLTSNYASGICNGEITDNLVQSSATSAATDLISVADVLAFDAEFSCALSRIQASDTTLTNGQLVLRQVAGKSTMSLSFADFFGGKFQTDISIDVNTSPIPWEMSFNGSEIDSRKLFALTESKLNWQAPLSAQGSFKMFGNTEQALAASVVGEAQLDGGQGSIDVSQIKKVLILINQVAGADKPVEELPDQLQYNNLQAAWTIIGPANTVVLDLDNLRASAAGPVQFLEDNLSLIGEAVVQTPQRGQQIKLAPVLLNAPIPFNCEGKLAEPSCKPDTSAVGKLLVQVVKNTQQDKVKEKLDQVIKEQVPEQFREAAKQLLNLFGK